MAFAGTRFAYKASIGIVALKFGIGNGIKIIINLLNFHVAHISIIIAQRDKGPTPNTQQL